MKAYYTIDYMHPDRELYFSTEEEAKEYAEQNGIDYDVLDGLSVSEYLRVIPSGIAEPIAVPFDVI